MNNKQFLKAYRKLLTKNEKGCWIYTKSIQGSGYAQVHISGVMVLMHRLAYQVFIGPIPTKMYVLHSCDVRNCVNPDHLFLGTPRDNMKDMVKKGRHRNRYS